MIFYLRSAECFFTACTIVYVRGLSSAHEEIYGYLSVALFHNTLSYSM